MKARDLTVSEKKCVTLIKTLEKAVHENRLTVSLFATPESAIAAAKLPIPMFKIDYDPKESRYIVTYKLGQYVAYVEVAFKLLGVRVNEYGHIITKDDLIINMQYLD